MIFIPQAIAYAYLAGMPPIYGLYAGLIPLIVYALFGTSRQMSIGPVAVSAILVMSGVSQLAEPLSPEYVSLVLLTGLLIGIMQIILSFLRLGFFVNFLSHPVIAGFISAAAIIIIGSQLKDGLGFSIPRFESTFDTFAYAITHIGETHILTMIMCVISLAMILGLKKWKRSFPGALTVVVLATIVTRVFNLDQEGVAIIKEVPKGFPAFIPPDISIASIKALVPTVLTVTFIGIVESIGIAKSLEMKHKSYIVRPNQELFALGISKIAGSFFQALPTSGSFTRSAINDSAGAKTNISSLITAFLVLLALLFLTPLFYYIPKAVLAAIILVSVLNLINIAEAKYLWKTRRRDLMIMILTFLVTLVLGIETGVIAGVILSFGLLLYSSSRPHVVELGNIPGTSHYRNLARFPEAYKDDKFLIIRFDNQLIFGNSNYFKDAIKKLLLSRETSPEYLILVASNIHDIDSTGLHALKDIIDILNNQGIQLVICDATGPVRDLLKRSGIMDSIGTMHHFMHVSDAVSYLNDPDSESSKSYATQFNQRR